MAGIGLAVKFYQQHKGRRDDSSLPSHRSRHPAAEEYGRSEPIPVAPVGAPLPREQPKPKDTKRSKALEAFRKLDRDDSGDISRAELQTVLDHLPQNIADAGSLFRNSRKSSTR